MKFRYEGCVGTPAFDSKDEFTQWLLTRHQRASSRFPDEVKIIGDIGPLSVSRTALDAEADIAVVVEKLKADRDRDIAVFRMPLDAEFSVLQLECCDAETGMIHQFNIGLRSDFNWIDRRSVCGAPAPPSPVEGETAGAAAVAEFCSAYEALRRSAQFSIHPLAISELKSTRGLFAGFCPRCDGLLERTGLSVSEVDHRTLLWEQCCLDCGQRFLGWERGDGCVPPGWKAISSTEAQPNRRKATPWWKPRRLFGK